MNIVFIASEADPFVKTGGLADVIGSLPEALNKEGHRVQVIIPKYKIIPSPFKDSMYNVFRGKISLGWRNLYCGVDALRHEGVNYYFIDNEYYFGRENIYGYSDDIDEAERFLFFSKAAIEVLPHILSKPDILHVHDWQTAMIPVYLHYSYKNNPYYKDIKTVFTIHNLKYQGIFSSSLLGDVIDLEGLNFYDLEFYGSLNLMKGALTHADKITTVSESYSYEIQTEFYGEGLDGLLQSRNHDLHGILNGISLSNYDPETDCLIEMQYRDTNGKCANKQVLQTMFKLPRSEAPMIAIISRIVPQKGFDLILHVLDELLEYNDVQVVLLGTGDKGYEHHLANIAQRHSDKFSVKFCFNEKIARQIYAGSDLFLMPSLFEPCGLSQLIALRYATVPIVRETGGLKDTIQSFNEYTKEGNGFSFKNYNAHDMLHTIRRAIHYFHNKEIWNKILMNGQQWNFGWEYSARCYGDLYQQLVGERARSEYVSE